MRLKTRWRNRGWLRRDWRLAIGDWRLAIGDWRVAYKGLVYDVTTSSFWRTGLHRDLHWAGQDLTDEIADAPHTELVFHKFPIVGRLKI
ncbi:MAG: hypothetical protein B6D41_07115 [Chloroflexi bacterium UTCFX4]|nr:MAG: hypothetical protein B6D41_07115 [Chloroflexi bacterium UTCFX4]